MLFPVVSLLANLQARHMDVTLITHGDDGINTWRRSRRLLEITFTNSQIARISSSRRAIAVYAKLC
jgi:hypothetical protein